MAHADVSGDSRPVTEVIPWFEEGSQARMESLPDPRIFKSHSPYSMVARTEASPAKYIYIARNPRDTAVSMFHHMRGFKSFDYHGEWDDFFQLFLQVGCPNGRNSLPVPNPSVLLT